MLLTVITPAEAAAELARRFGRPVGRVERLPLALAAGRVTAAELIAPHPLPPFPRSTVDGYAVVSADTAGATESIPALLTLAGRITLGDPAPAPPVGRGACVYAPTGAPLPEGADAVVMVEYASEPVSGEVALERPAAPGENVLRAGEDLAAGSAALPAGTLLGAPEIGLLAACGITDVPVIARPRVAVLSSGDEIVPPEADPGPGRMRDANGPALAAACRLAGAEPVSLGILPDDPAALASAMIAALETCDALLLSGGSSAGTRDHTVAAIEASGGSVLAHGLAMKPGKPTILGDLRGKPAIGLPGHPAACLVVFRRLVAPLLRRLAGLPEPLTPALPATLERDHPSAPGREEILPVRLLPSPHGPVARPVYGKSGALSPLTGSHGYVVIPASREGLAEGEAVEVHPW